jgi:hypothetical protein
MRIQLKTIMEVRKELVPTIRELNAKYKRSRRPNRSSSRRSTPAAEQQCQITERALIRIDR